MKKTKIFSLFVTLLLCFALMISMVACTDVTGGEQGDDGDKGANGLSAYEIYLKYYPNYLGNERDWVDDMADGKLNIKHSVTFYTSEGNVMYSVEVPHRNGLEKPTREFHTFINWFKDIRCENPLIEGKDDIITEDISIYTTWNYEPTSFRGQNEHKGVSDAKTPISSDDIKLSWSNKLAIGWTASPGFPIEVGDFLYIPRGSDLLRLSKKDGSILKTVKMAAKIGFFSSITYGGGKIFVPIENGKIQAFDEKEMTSLWISETPKDAAGEPLKGMQSLSPITYYNGHVYMGITHASAGSGAFFCLSTMDEDKNNDKEVKDFTWCYVPSQKGGFYWSEGVVVGNSIIFTGEEGVVYTHSLTGNELNEDGSIKFIDKFVLPDANGGQATNEAVRSSLFYDEYTGRVLMTTKAGNIHSVKVSKEGVIDENSIATTFIENDITSSPTVFRGRVYVGGGGISSNAGLSVLDAETLAIIYQDKSFKTQSSPMLTTAYATAENNYTVYVYFLSYTNPDFIYMLTDYQGNTEANLTKLTDSEFPQYNSSSIMIGRDGSLYYKNDSGYLFCYKTISDNSFTANDVDNAIALLSDRVEKDCEILALKRAKYRYDLLSAEEKARVKQFSKLENLYKQLNL